jgi:hypothetical protein
MSTPIVRTAFVPPAPATGGVSPDVDPRLAEAQHLDGLQRRLQADWLAVEDRLEALRWPKALPARKKLTVFSCRAAGFEDLAAFFSRLVDEDARPDVHTAYWYVRLLRDRFSGGFGSPQLEFETELSLAQLRAIIRQLHTDAHVMEQTLRPCSLAENSLERDMCTPGERRRARRRARATVERAR